MKNNDKDEDQCKGEQEEINSKQMSEKRWYRIRRSWQYFMLNLVKSMENAEKVDANHQK